MEQITEKQLGNEIHGAAAETAHELKRTQCTGQENQKNCRQQETEKVSQTCIYKGHLRGSQGSPLPKTESTESRGDNKAEGRREGTPLFPS